MAQPTDANGDKEPVQDVNAAFAETYKALTDGERQASKMESGLSAIEKKLDALLAEFEQANGTAMAAKEGEKSDSVKPEETRAEEIKEEKKE